MTQIPNDLDFTSFREEKYQFDLSRKNLTSEPMDLFRRWITQAYYLRIPNANAMSIGTVDESGQSYQRIVFLKSFDMKDMIFYTNSNSRKSKHLLKNPKISGHFFWNILEKQILILGKVKHLSKRETLNYFQSRPRKSQISAWASKQSSVIPNRKFLELKFKEMKKKFREKKEIPLPNFWTGYRITINSIEFWQKRKYRLHDRFLYEKKQNCWKINRLSP